MLLHDTDMPPIDRVAAGLDTTTRTLERKLAAESTSYRTLVDEARRATAEDLLTATTLSIDQIATHLHYAHTAGFIHAFARWHQTTPTRYRDTYLDRAMPRGGRTRPDGPPSALPRGHRRGNGPS